MPDSPPRCDLILFPNGEAVVALDPGAVDPADLRVSADGLVSVPAGGGVRALGRLPAAFLPRARSEGVVVVDVRSRRVSVRRLGESVR